MEFGGEIPAESPEEGEIIEESLSQQLKKEKLLKGNKSHHEVDRGGRKSKNKSSSYSHHNQQNQVQNKNNKNTAASTTTNNDSSRRGARLTHDSLKRLKNAFSSTTTTKTTTTGRNKNDKTSSSSLPSNKKKKVDEMTTKKGLKSSGSSAGLRQQNDVEEKRKIRQLLSELDSSRSKSRTSSSSSSSSPSISPSSTSTSSSSTTSSSAVSEYHGHDRRNLHDELISVSLSRKDGSRDVNINKNDEIIRIRRRRDSRSRSRSITRRELLGHNHQSRRRSRSRSGRPSKNRSTVSRSRRYNSLDSSRRKTWTRRYRPSRSPTFSRSPPSSTYSHRRLKRPEPNKSSDINKRNYEESKENYGLSRPRPRRRRFPSYGDGRSNKNKNRRYERRRSSTSSNSSSDLVSDISTTESDSKKFNKNVPTMNEDEIYEPDTHVFENISDFEMPNDHHEAPDDSPDDSSPIQIIEVMKPKTPEIVVISDDEFSNLTDREVRDIEVDVLSAEENNENKITNDEIIVERKEELVEVDDDEDEDLYEELELRRIALQALVEKFDSSSKNGKNTKNTTTTGGITGETGKTCSIEETLKKIDHLESIAYSAASPIHQPSSNPLESSRPSFCQMESSEYENLENNTDNYQETIDLDISNEDHDHEEYDEIIIEQEIENDDDEIRPVIKKQAQQTLFPPRDPFDFHEMFRNICQNEEIDQEEINDDEIECLTPIEPKKLNVSQIKDIFGTHYQILGGTRIGRGIYYTNIIHNNLNIINWPTRNYTFKRKLLGKLQENYFSQRFELVRPFGGIAVSSLYECFEELSRRAYAVQYLNLIAANTTTNDGIMTPSTDNCDNVDHQHQAIQDSNNFLIQPISEQNIETLQGPEATQNDQIDQDNDDDHNASIMVDIAQTLGEIEENKRLEMFTKLEGMLENGNLRFFPSPTKLVQEYDPASPTLSSESIQQQQSLNQSFSSSTTTTSTTSTNNNDMLKSPVPLLTMKFDVEVLRSASKEKTNNSKKRKRTKSSSKYKTNQNHLSPTIKRTKATTTELNENEATIIDGEEDILRAQLLLDMAKRTCSNFNKNENENKNTTIPSSTTMTTNTSSSTTTSTTVFTSSSPFSLIKKVPSLVSLPPFVYPFNTNNSPGGVVVSPLKRTIINSNTSTPSSTTSTVSKKNKKSSSPNMLNNVFRSMLKSKSHHTSSSSSMIERTVDFRNVKVTIPNRIISPIIIKVNNDESSEESEDPGTNQSSLPSNFESSLNTFLRSARAETPEDNPNVNVNVNNNNCCHNKDLEKEKEKSSNQTKEPVKENLKVSTTTTLTEKPQQSPRILIHGRKSYIPSPLAAKVCNTNTNTNTSLFEKSSAAPKASTIVPESTTKKSNLIPSSKEKTKTILKAPTAMRHMPKSKLVEYAKLKQKLVELSAKKEKSVNQQQQQQQQLKARLNENEGKVKTTTTSTELNVIENNQDKVSSIVLPSDQELIDLNRKSISVVDEAIEGLLTDKIVVEDLVENDQLFLSALNSITSDEITNQNEKVQTMMREPSIQNILECIEEVENKSSNGRNTTPQMTLVEQKEELFLREQLLRATLIRKMQTEMDRLDLVKLEKELVSKRKNTIEVLKNLSSKLTRFTEKRNEVRAVEKEVLTLKSKLAHAEKQLRGSKNELNVLNTDIQESTKTSQELRQNCNQLSDECRKVGGKVIASSSSQFQSPTTVKNIQNDDSTCTTVACPSTSSNYKLPNPKSAFLLHKLITEVRSKMIQANKTSSSSCRQNQVGINNNNKLMRPLCVQDFNRHYDAARDKKKMMVLINPNGLTRYSREAPLEDKTTKVYTFDDVLSNYDGPSSKSSTKGHEEHTYHGYVEYESVLNCMSTSTWNNWVDSEDTENLDGGGEAADGDLDDLVDDGSLMTLAVQKRKLNSVVPLCDMDLLQVCDLLGCPYQHI